MQAQTVFDTQVHVLDFELPFQDVLIRFVQIQEQRMESLQHFIPISKETTVL
jgi:hypothetical protein